MSRRGALGFAAAAAAGLVASPASAKEKIDYAGHTSFGFVPPPISGTWTYAELLEQARAGNIDTVQIAVQQDRVVATTKGDHHRYSCAMPNKDVPFFLTDALGADGILPFTYLQQNPLLLQVRAGAIAACALSLVAFVADQLGLLPWDTTPYNSIEEREEAQAEGRGGNAKQRREAAEEDERAQARATLYREALKEADAAKAEEEKALQQRQGDGNVDLAGSRSAKEIFLEGLAKLQTDPMGWFFGPPSPLYSNTEGKTPTTTQEGQQQAEAAAAKEQQAEAAAAMEKTYDELMRARRLQSEEQARMVAAAAEAKMQQPPPYGQMPPPGQQPGMLPGGQPMPQPGQMPPPQMGGGFGQMPPPGPQADFGGFAGAAQPQPPPQQPGMLPQQPGMPPPPQADFGGFAGAGPDMAEAAAAEATAWMAAGSTSPIELYEASLRRAFHPVTWLRVSDKSDGHTKAGFEDGRALDADGLELHVLVVSECFQGRSPLARQQMVNSVLIDDLRSGRIHSVQMKCWTPAQWVSHQRWNAGGQPATLEEARNAAARSSRDAAARARARDTAPWHREMEGRAVPTEERMAPWHRDMEGRMVPTEERMAPWHRDMQGRVVPTEGRRVLAGGVRSTRSRSRTFQPSFGENS